MIFVTVYTNGQSKTYFLSHEGNDANSGLSIHDSWKTLEKVNLFTFQPGDIILLKSGETWHGQLFPKGAGIEGKPIVISSYGGIEKPIIDIDDAEGAAIRLVNQSWWEIRNLEITSGTKPKPGIGRQGIVALFEGNNAGIEHIVIENCYIHDVWGQMGPNTKYCDYNSSAIYVGTILGARGSLQNSFYDDILIQKNRIERVDKCGIVVYFGRNKVIVKNNYLENLGGDAIFVNGPDKGLIEYNVAKRTCMRSGDLDLEGGNDFWPHTAAIWIQNTEGTIMQYNEVYHTGRQPKNGDGFAYDFDFDANNCILQYNYSQNNHGFLLIMNNTFGNITRYNISENDQTHLIQMQGSLEDQNLIHNNVFYVDYSTIDLDFFIRQPDKSKIGAYFRNNIFYAHGQGRFRTVYTSGDVLVRKFDDTYKVPSSVAAQMYQGNCFYGTWLNGIPEDTAKITEDPLFVDAGTGGEGLSTLLGYQLRPESPCINAGKPVAFVEQDFWGNPINDGSIDIGPYEQIGSGVFGDPKIQETLNRTENARMELKRAKMSFPQRIIVPDEGGKITVSLTKPLSKDISGTIRFIGNGQKVRPQSIIFNNTEREHFTFLYKQLSNDQKPLGASIILENNGLEEKIDLPVYYSRRGTLKSLDNCIIDGDLDDWNTVSSLDINTKSQVISSIEKWQTPKDGSCTFKAAVSGDNLLIAIHVIDKQIVTEGLNNDRVEIYYREMAIGQNRGYSGGTIFLPAQPVNGILQGLSIRVGRRETPITNAIKTYYKTLQNGYSMELSIPFKDLGFSSVPEKGSETGFEVVLNNAMNDVSGMHQIRMSSTGSDVVGYGNAVFNRFVK